jgi:hypothetical protein
MVRGGVGPRPSVMDELGRDDAFDRELAPEIAAGSASRRLLLGPTQTSFALDNAVERRFLEFRQCLL